VIRRRFTAGALLVAVVATAAPAFAQQPGAQPGGAAALKRKGDIKMWIGGALMVGGAFTLPATVGHNPEGKSDPLLAGVGMMMAGSGILWWGFHDKRKAMQPTTTLGVAIGGVSGVQVRRSW
jgi:hypothetical protein